jgi:hypothetical protein
MCLVPKAIRQDETILPHTPDDASAFENIRAVASHLAIHEKASVHGEELQWASALYFRSVFAHDRHLQMIRPPDTKTE